MKRGILVNLMFCCSFAVAGCAGSDYGGDDGSDPTADDGGDGGEDDNGDSGGEDTTDPTEGDNGEGESEGGGESGGPSEVSFGGDVLPIIGARCSCHRGAAPSAGLDLNDDAAFDSLVGVQSGVAPLTFVEPGSGDASYLLAKLQGTQAAAGGGGSQMPLGGELIEEELVTIEAWVDGGAQP